MDLSFGFFLKSILLGVGLAMDAFSVSVADGLCESNMKKRKMAGIAGAFGFFQAAMPLIGWYCIHTFVTYFEFFKVLVPWIALILLSWLGGKMIYDAVKGKKDNSPNGAKITFILILTQGVATSIDALSVGFTISDYNWVQAVICAIVIAVVTFIICMIGLLIGRRIGEKLLNRAGILGGVILILIGLEIFISNLPEALKVLGE
ncbi:MAG: manganese efflux pump [Ruminococcaceae bacterium]|nr:manganese efflux pump [Oscillospiraceae bacterium]